LYVLNTLGLFIFGVLFSLSYSKYSEGQRLARESMARLALYTIRDQQEEFRKTTSHIATLNELAQNGLLDQSYANGMPEDGYTFSISDLSEKTYCIHADRAEDNSGYNDYLLCEDGLLRFSRSIVKGSVQRGKGEFWPYPSSSSEKVMFDPCR